MLTEIGQVDESLQISNKALNVLKQLSDANPTNATLRQYTADTYDIRAGALQKKGDLDGALNLERAVWNTYHQLAKADPGNMLAQTNLAWTDLNIAEILISQDHPAEALPHIRRALAIFRAGAGNRQLWEATELGQSYSDLGLAYIALAEQATTPAERDKTWRAARSWYQQALDVWNQRPARAGTLDAFGHNQSSAITRQLALCDAHLRQSKPSLHASNPHPEPSEAMVPREP
jgi:tetratricopeptide (TPR) repeat protein